MPSHLSLSFNFKEEFNEYWAVSGSGAYFLQGEDGSMLQQKIQYGNLQIPAIFQGFVVIPFYSFSVPEWNTALGDKVMKLARIESYAIAVNIGEVLPHAFQIDDIEVFARPEFKTLEIQGSDTIQIPTSGEHREQYIALLGTPSEKTSEPVKAAWTVRQPADALIKIDDSGILTIPAGAKGNSITLSATYTLPENSVSGEFKVVLAGGSAPDAGQAADQPATKPITHNRIIGQPVLKRFRDMGHGKQGAFRCYLSWRYFSFSFPVITFSAAFEMNTGRR